MIQPKLHKRLFLVEYLIKEYAKKTTRLHHLFELWSMAEVANIHVNPRLRAPVREALLEKENFNLLLKILQRRDESHDSLIGQLMQILLRKKQQAMAFYLSSKISSPFNRLWYAADNILKLEFPIEDDRQFFKNVYLSVRHDKIANDFC